MEPDLITDFAFQLHRFLLISYSLTPFMRKKPLTLSIVIPVFNEERYLKSCLDAIAVQTIKPDEVIVVDNNSTDRSIEIAKRYSFVKILHEKRQHQVFAQVTGFNLSKSEILGRIDGDTILPYDWVAKIKRAFEDKKIVAATGGAEPFDVPLKWLGMAIFHWYIYTAGRIAGIRLLWGANCAIRATAWQRIRDRVLMRGDIWEDYDMSFCLKGIGKIKYIPKMRVGVSARSLHTSFLAHVKYQFRSVRTFYFRASPLRLSLFILLWTATLLLYPLAAFDDWLYNLKEKKN